MGHELENIECSDHSISIERSYVTIATVRNTVTEFIKCRSLQWAGHVDEMEEHRIPKEALQQTIHSRRRV
jgi:hypothetical protein